VTQGLAFVLAAYATFMRLISQYSIDEEQFRECNMKEVTEISVLVGVFKNMVANFCLLGKHDQIAELI
jgi:hypothetical protein